MKQEDFPQDDFAMWPRAMTAAREAAATAVTRDRMAERSAALCAALRSACLTEFAARGVAEAERAAILADALAFLIVDASGQLDLRTPAVSRIEWLLNRVSRAAWAAQLARSIPETSRGSHGFGGGQSSACAAGAAS